MSFVSDPFDSFDSGASSRPELEKFDRFDKTETAVNRQHQVVIRIDLDLCETTGVCAEVCPEDVIEHVAGHTTVARSHACTECWICVENCVSGAIEIG